MKLYGIATAAIPDEENPCIVNLICTPIEISDENMNRFNILEGMRFKASFDMNDTADIMNKFERLVDVLDQVTQLQEESCRRNGAEYRPVPLIIGQDNSRSVNFDAISALLFGDLFTGTNDEIRDNRDNIAKIKNIPDDEIFSMFLSHQASSAKTYFQSIPLEQKSIIIKAYRDSLMLRNQSSALDALSNHHEYMKSERDIAKIIGTQRKLADLLKKCVLQVGSFSSYSDNAASIDKQIAEIPELKKIMDAQPENPSPHYRLIDIAYEIGKYQGELTTINPPIFKLIAPKGYWESEEAKQEDPQHCFYDWNPAYKNAFHQGFSETYLGPYTRRMKLPTDGNNPPFTDPVADMVRDQFQIVAGRRSEDGVVDEKKWRQRIVNMAQQAHARINHAPKTGQDLDM